MTYSLVRKRDGAGDSGPMSDIGRLNPETKEVEWERNARPRVGWVVTVGSRMGRSYQVHDYWTTTYVTEIDSDTPKEVHFKTSNSEYVWKQTNHSFFLQ